MAPSFQELKQRSAVEAASGSGDGHDVATTIRVWVN